MNARPILLSQYPTLILLARLRIRRMSAVKSMLWVTLFGIALTASVAFCFL